MPSKPKSKESAAVHQSAKKSEAITKRPVQQAIEQVPDYLRLRDGEQRKGMGTLGQADILVPRLVLAQSSSPERKRGNPKLIDGLEEGQFFNSVTKEVYGESLRVVNLYYYRSRIRWAGDEIGSGIKCSSQDGVTGIGDPGGACLQCPFAQFSKEERPECNLFANFPLLVLDEDGNFEPTNVIVYPLKSIALTEAKKWNSLVTIRNTHRFAGVYKLTAVADHRTSGDSFQPRIENEGWIRADQVPFAQMASKLIEDFRSEGRFGYETEREPGEEA